MAATSLKKTQTLGFKLSMLILAFLLVVLGSCGVLTYFNQMSSYREQCKTNLRDVGEYLENLIAADGEDFVRYQTYFLEHYDEVNIPVDADEYYRTGRITSACSTRNIPERRWARILRSTTSATR